MFEKKGAGVVACIKCDTVLKIKSGSTSSMKNHATSQHAKFWNEILDEEESKKAKQPTIDNFVKSESKKVERYPVNSIKRKTLNRKLVKFIAKDMRPVSIVRNSGFQEFVRELDPKYVLPTTVTIRTKLLPMLYNESMKELGHQLENAKFVTMTTDGWTSANSDKYNAFTIHWVDWSKPEIKSKILECAPFEKRSTSIELEKELRRIIEKFHIKDKLVLDVADNAYDIQGALALVGIARLGCTAHKFNLAAKNVIDSEKVSDLKSKCSQLVRTTKISANAKKVLHGCLKQVGIQGNNNFKSLVS